MIFVAAERAHSRTSTGNSVKYLILSLLLASCGTAHPVPPPAAPAPQTTPKLDPPELVDLPEDPQDSSEVDAEDPNDEFCSEFLESEGEGPAACDVLEDDEDFAIVMKTTDVSKPVSTYWAVYCHGQRAEKLPIPAGLPDSLRSLSFKRDQNIQIKWLLTTPATSGTTALPLPKCGDLRNFVFECTYEQVDCIRILSAGDTYGESQRVKLGFI